MNAEARRVDRWSALLGESPIDEAMVEVSRGLSRLRDETLLSGAWPEVCASEQMARLRRVAHLCPYTRRGYEKPRGYPGDAVLLDHIYGGAPIPEDTTPRGEAILAWMRDNSSGFQSVRWRRDHFAGRLDAVAHEHPGSRVASIACGHFREGTRSAAVVGGQFRHVLALDQDPRTLRVVESEQPGVTPTRASVRDLIAGRLLLDRCHLIYSAGLFDYLIEPHARKLIARLFSALAPGGMLIVANFVRMWEAGWMEALMDWHLIYRSPHELLRLSEGLAPGVAETRTYLDPPGNVAYLEVRRR